MIGGCDPMSSQKMSSPSSFFSIYKKHQQRKASEEETFWSSALGSSSRESILTARRWCSRLGVRVFSSLPRHPPRVVEETAPIPWEKPRTLPGWEAVGPLPSEHLYKYTPRLPEPTDKEYEAILPRLLDKWRIQQRAMLKNLAVQARAYYEWEGGEDILSQRQVWHK